MSQESRVFPARMDAFPGVAAFLEEACTAARLGRHECLRLRLVVEELFTNTVLHGHRQDSDEPVTLALAAQPGQIAVIYEDTAPPYDPVSAVKAPDDSTGMEEKIVGGLGVVLIAGMAEHLEYSYAGGRNRVSLLISTSR